MDDHHLSPPSSKKSSAICKADLVDTPHMSPYRTRSRKNSNLTEENIAVHNDSPIAKPPTRSVTRRMSQGSETAPLTPVPSVTTKRNRRSSSVTSDDAGVVTKPKFTLAQENVVMEEDELLDESKASNVIENGSSHVNKLDKNEVSKIEVDDNAAFESKLMVSNDSNKIDLKAEKTKNETVSKTFDLKRTSDLELGDMENVSVKLNKINFPEQMETITEKENGEESVKTKVTPPMASEIVALVSEPVSINNTNSDGVGKPKSDVLASVPDNISTIGAENVTNSGQSTDMVNSAIDPASTVVPNLTNSISSSENTKVSTVGRDDGNSNVPKTPIPQMSTKSTIVDKKFMPITPKILTPIRQTRSTIAASTRLNLLATPSKSTVATSEDEIIIIPETPLKPNTEIETTSVEIETEIPETPPNAVSIDMDISIVNKENQSKTTPESMDVTVLNIETPTKIIANILPVDMDLSEETPIKIADTPSNTIPVNMDMSVVYEEILSKPVPVDIDISIVNKETPTKTTPVAMEIAKTSSNIIPLEVNVTVLNKESPLKTAPADNDVQVLNEKTPTKTPSNNMSLVVDSSIDKDAPKVTNTPAKIVPAEKQDSLDVSHQATASKIDPLAKEAIIATESNQETPSKTVAQESIIATEPNQETPSKTVAQEAIIATESNQETPSETVAQEAIIATESNQETPSKTVVLENGTTTTEEQYGKFGGSVHRKSDGKPIDTFGIYKKVTETTTLTVKKQAKNKSVMSINDSSDESDNEDDIPNNEFLDDEAMESNGESSMDEEDRKYLEENEIPTDGISLGSDTDTELADTEESKDSFIVSDSSGDLLNGSGDDLEIDNEKSTLNTSKGMPKRGNKICDTSEDESAMEKLDEKPKKFNLKRRSDTMPRAKAIKRLSLHPNTKLNSGKLKVSDEELIGDSSSEEMEAEGKEKQQNKIDDSSEEDIAKELANLDAEPKKLIASKRLSGVAQPLSKKDVKRMSLHPNTKLNNLESEKTNDELALETSTGNDTEVNKVLDSISLDTSDSRETITSKKVAASKRLSKTMSGSRKDQTLTEENVTKIDDSSEDDITEILANVDVEPKKSIASKRLSDSVSHPKKDKKNMKRMSLHPSAKFNCDGFEPNQNKSILADTTIGISNTNLQNDIEEMDDEPSTSQSVPSKSTGANQHKGGNFNIEAIQAKCDAILNSANEAKREEKMKHKAELQEEKYLKLKEKKQKKLQEKKDKEARQIEREVLAVRQRQLKKDKKIHPKDITEDEKIKAIQKALAFSEKVKATKILHSTDAIKEMPNGTNEGKNATTAVKTNRKRKMLTILDDEPILKKKKKASQPSQLPAKPEAFTIHSKPIQKPKNLKLHKDKLKVIRSIENTSAGIFEVRNVSKKSSPFTVTSLEYNPPLNSSSFKDKAILGSNVKRESAAELLSRKQAQRRKALQKQ